MQEQEEEKNSNWKVQKAPWQQPALEILFSYINLGQKAELAMLCCFALCCQFCSVFPARVCLVVPRWLKFAPRLVCACCTSQAPFPEERPPVTNIYKYLQATSVKLEKM